MKHGERVVILDKGTDRLGRIYEKNTFVGKDIIYGSISDNEVNPVENISHTFTEFQIEEDGTVSAIFKVLDSPHGIILQKIIEADTKINTCIRGIGFYDDFTRKVSHYQIIAINISA